MTPSAAGRGSGSKPANVWEPPTPEELQREISQYKILDLLGRGGMGAVYKGWQVSLDRYVAIKILPPGVDDADAQFTARFKQEARTMAKFQHPGIVSVYDAGETGTGLLYIVMEFVEGTDVAQMVKSQGRLTVDYALAITAHVCDALQYAHSHGVIHRDIKPANIMLNTEGSVKVTDFGLAKGSDAGQGGLTKTNLAMGTPDYVAPEALIAGMPLDHRADLYAVGVMLYNMLTGEIPRGMFKMPSQKVGSDPRFDAIISKAMEQERECRYQAAYEIRRDLDVILRTPQVQSEASPRQGAASSRKPLARGPGQTEAGLSGQARSAIKAGRESPASVKKSSVGRITGIVGAAAVIAIGGFFAFKKPKPPEKPDPLAGGAIHAASPAIAPAAPDAVATTKPAELPADGAWLDLLPLVEAPVPVSRDPARNVSGAWSLDGGILAVEKSGPHEGVALPVEMPGSYDVSLRMKTEGLGISHVGVLLPVAGRMIKFNTVQRTGGPSGITSIDRIATGNQPPGFVKFAPSYLQADVERLVEFAVREAGDNASITVKADGEKVFEWSGPKDKLEDDREHGTRCPAGKVALTASMSANATYRDVRARRVTGEAAMPIAATVPITPPVPGTTPESPVPAPALAPMAPKTEPGWTNLLAGADVQRDSLMSPWTLTDGVLRSPVEPDDKGTGHQTFEFRISNPPRDYDLRYRVSRNQRGFGIVMPFVRGEESPSVIIDGGHGFGLQEGRGGKSRQQKLWLPPDGSMHEVLIEVREGHVRVKFDGSLEEEWAGALPQGQGDRAFYRSDKVKGPIFGIGVCKGNITVYSAEFRAVDAAAENRAALLAAHPRLVQIEAGFKSRDESDAQKPFLAAVAALNQSYVANGIARARAASQKAGRLDEVTALDAEKARIEKGEGVPAEDDEGTPASLAALRKTYREALAKHGADRDRKTAALYDVYLNTLDSYIAELTKADKLDDARNVKVLRDEIAGRKPEAAPAPAALATPAAKAGAPRPGPPAAVKTPEVRPIASSYWREAAKWLVANGGSCRVAYNKIEQEVKTEKEIPPGKFDIVELSFDRQTSPGAPPTDADFKVFNGIRSLRRVWVRTTGLSDAAFGFLAANAELAWLNLEGVPDVTDGVLQHVSNARKLSSCQVIGAVGFTGKGLAQMRWLPLLLYADFLGSSIGDEGLKALAGCAKLRSLRIASTNCTATDAGLAALAASGLTSLNVDGCPKFSDAGFWSLRGMKSLKDLTAARTAFGDEAAAAISKLTALETLDLSSTALTDAGIVKLSTLTKLKTLTVRGSKVSAAGVDAVKKALPKCLVTH